MAAPEKFKKYFFVNEALPGCWFPWLKRKETMQAESSFFKLHHGFEASEKSELKTRD